MFKDPFDPRSLLGNRCGCGGDHAPADHARLTADSGIGDLGVDLSGRIDQASVMLYQMEPGEMVSGAGSKCQLTPNTSNTRNSTCIAKASPPAIACSRVWNAMAVIQAAI